MSPIKYLADVPPGEVRTLVNPPSSAGGVVPAGAASTAIATVAVLLRLFTRAHVVRGVLGIDDYMCFCSLAFCIVYLAVSLQPFQHHHGGGMHEWDIRIDDFNPEFWKATMGSTLVYAVSIAFSKLSILTFLLRISPDRTFRRIVYGFIGLVVAYTLVYILLVVFRCRPIAASWDITIKGKCIESIVPLMTLNIANIIIDMIMLLLPIRVIVPLQIPPRQKISLVLLFATGGFVCVATIKRTIIMEDLANSKDYTWKVSQQIIWGYIEINAGLVCASVPALKPLVVKYIPSLVSSKMRNSNDKPSNDRQSHGTLEKKRKSYGIYETTYELRSRDELSDTAQNDDEARLWSIKASEKSNGLQRLDTTSFDSSMSDPAPQKPEPAATVGFTTKRKQDVMGMHITKVIDISYGPLEDLK